MTANRWKLIEGYQQTISRLYKGNAVCNWLLYETLDRQCFDVTYFDFEEFFHLGQRRPNSVMAVPNSHQQHVNCKYHSICKSSPSRGQNSKQRMRGFVEGKSFKVNCSTDGPKVVPL